MRVLAVGNRYPPAAAGGYERILAGTVAALGGDGHDVRVLTTEGGAPSTAEVARELRWYWRDGAFARPGPRGTVALERHNATVLARHLAEFRPDVVSWWGMGGLSLSLVEQVRRAGVPAVGVVGDGWMVYGPDADAWTRAWRSRPAAAAARIAEALTGVPARLDLGAGARWLFISQITLDRARQAGHDLPRTGLAHPGVDPVAFPFAEPGPWRGRLACIGRVEPRKGVAVAVEALAGLPGAALTVDGPDEGHRADLEALADRLGVRDRVTFAETPSGRVSEAYAAADAVLFPVTWPEPWGLVPLEAMSVGRPVVASGTGGSGEYLAAGENCLLARPGDPAALAAAVRRLAEDPQLRAALVRGGRATAARFTQDAFQRQVIGALGTALHGVRTPSAGSALSRPDGGGTAE